MMVLKLVRLFVELELKVVHNDSHATFLDLDISIDKVNFIYKMFDKRDTFNFHTVRMLSYYTIM